MVGQKGAPTLPARSQVGPTPAVSSCRAAKRDLGSRCPRVGVVESAQDGLPHDRAQVLPTFLPRGIETESPVRALLVVVRDELGQDLA